MQYCLFMSVLWLSGGPSRVFPTSTQWQWHNLQPPATPHRMNREITDELQKCRLVADPNVHKVLNHFYVRVCDSGCTCSAHNSMISQITILMIGWQKTTRFQWKLIWWPGTGNGRTKCRSWNFYWWELLGLDGRVHSNVCLPGFLESVIYQIYFSLDQTQNPTVCYECFLLKVQKSISPIIPT